MDAAAACDVGAGRTISLTGLTRRRFYVTIPMMRRMVMLAIVFAACASSNTGIGVNVTEVRSRTEKPLTLGSHHYRIRVTNRSGEPISVHSIHVQPAGMTELDVDDATETYDETVGPDATHTFDMHIYVRQSRAIERGGPNQLSFNEFIDSLRVMIIGQNGKGNFPDSGDYPIGVEPTG